MRARIVRVGIGVLLVLSGYMFGTYTSSSIHAEQRVSVPAAYGKVIAGDSGSIWFEDTSGTLRQVNVPQGNTIFTVARQR